jgi:hypothetical protein
MNFDRRTFLKLTVLGAGACLFGTPLVLSKDVPQVGFSIDDSPSKGCAFCKQQIEAMLQDKAMQTEIASHFPEGAKVNFYCKVQPANKMLGEHAIAVGNCCRALKNKADVFVSGCGAKILTVPYIYKSIVQQCKAMQKAGPEAP